MTYELANVMPQPARPKRRWVWWAAGAVVVAAVAAVVLVVTMNRDITVHGTLQLTQTQSQSSNADCAGEGGFSDIQQGAQITVTGPDGTVLGFTDLGPGHAPSAYECDFDFTVKVPAGKSSYGFTLGHRGTLQFTEADLRNGPLQMSLS